MMTTNQLKMTSLAFTIQQDLSFTGTVISSNNGWYNICDELIDEEGIYFYPQGYLCEKRWEEIYTNKFNKKVKIVLNAGL